MHSALRAAQHEMTELTRREDVTGHLLNARDGDLSQAGPTPQTRGGNRPLPGLIMHRADRTAPIPMMNLNKSSLQPSCIEPRRDHAALVDATNELHNNLASTMVIYDLQVTNVAVLLHHLQELDDDLGVWPDQDLPLAALLGIHDVVETVTEHANPHHLDDGAPKPLAWTEPLNGQEHDKT